MEHTAVFRRFEYKYLLTPEQYDALQDILQAHTQPDLFPHSSIRNIYYDTPDFRLIRTSLEHPNYKEKLRLRSYGPAGEGSPVFAELKKKYDGVVYKRRITLDAEMAMSCLSGAAPMPDSQIGKEIDWALHRYPGLRPAVFISYERDSFRQTDGDLRITFDRDIRYRTQNLNLSAGTWGIPLLPEGKILMELKLTDSIPLWLAQTLSRLDIRRTGFSKYGSAYQNLNICKGEYQYA